jgi:hypothetical protein
MEIMKSLFFKGRVQWWLLGLVTLAGCYSQSADYRAVANVGLTRPNDVGSQGPLILVTATTNPSQAASGRPSLASAIDRLTLNQIAVMDRGMADDLRELQEARAHLDELKATLPPKDERISDAEESARIAQKRVDAYAADWRELQKKLAIAESPNYGNTSQLNGNPLEAASITSNTPQIKQTVLMISEHKNWGDYGSSFGRTVVLIIDGPLKPGQYWLTPENSVLIMYSSQSAPARTRVGLAGSVKVLSVHDDQIVADVAVRQTFDTDSGDFMDHYQDPTVWQIPWLIEGKHTFVVTKPSDPAFEKSAVRWVTD